MATSKYYKFGDNDLSIELVDYPKSVPVLGTDVNGNPISSDVSVVASGDLVGTYPAPKVKELTGVPAILVPSRSTFNWLNLRSDWAAGAGLGFGYGYVNGTKAKCWMALSQAGELQISYDEWETLVYSSTVGEFESSTDCNGVSQKYNLMPNASSYRYANVSYLEVPGQGYFWLFGANPQVYSLKDEPSSFNANGSVDISKLRQVKFTTGGYVFDSNSISSSGSTMVFTGSSDYIGYSEAADISYDSTTKKLSITQHMATKPTLEPDDNGRTPSYTYAGGSCYGNGKFLSFDRDTGVLISSVNGKTWSLVKLPPVKFQDGTEMIHSSIYECTYAVPMNSIYPWSPYLGNVWGGITYAGDMFVQCNGADAPISYLKSASTEREKLAILQGWSPFIFSYDGINWHAYKPTLAEMGVNYTYSMYKITYGYGKIFATNASPSQCSKKQPAIYRLLVDEIVAHRKLNLEKGASIAQQIPYIQLTIA